MRTNNNKLEDDQRKLTINGVEHIITLGKTKFASAISPQLLTAENFKNNDQPSIWVYDSEGIEEGGNVMTLKFEYITKVINENEDSNIQNSQDNAVNPQNSIDDIKAIEDDGLDLSTDDEMQIALSERLNQITNNQHQQKNGDNKMPGNVMSSNNRKRHNNKNRHKPYSDGNNINGENQNFEKMHSHKQSLSETLGNNSSFNDLYFDKDLKFGTPVTLEDFSNILSGNSSIDLAVRFTYTKDVDKIGNVVRQELMDGKSIYAVAYIGYMNPLDNGDAHVNYYSLVLVCQKLSVLFAGKKIAIQSPSFDDMDKVTKIFEKELSSIEEVFICN